MKSQSHITIIKGTRRNNKDVLDPSEIDFDITDEN